MATKTVTTSATTWTFTYSVSETTTSYKVTVSKIVAKKSSGTWSSKFYADIGLETNTLYYDVGGTYTLPKGDSSRTWSTERSYTIQKSTTADNWWFAVDLCDTEWDTISYKTTAKTAIGALPQYTLTINWLTVTNGVAKYEAQKHTKYHGQTLTFNARPAYNDDGLVLTGYLCTNSAGTGTKYSCRSPAYTWTATSNLTLYELATHTVSYNGNGSTSGSVSSNVVYFPSSHTVASNGFSKTGYSFSHWSSKADNTGKTYTPGQALPTNNFDVFPTLYAIWKRTVTYNINYSGGTGAPSAQSSAINAPITLSSAIPTRDGYTFLGWSTTSSGTVEYAAGATYPVNNPTVTLYAVWGPAIADDVTVTRTDSNGNPDILGGCIKATFSVSNQTSYTVTAGSLLRRLTDSTSGTKNVIIVGDLESFNPELSYTMRITVGNAVGNVYKSVTIPKSSYARPVISSVTAIRVNANRQDDDEGTFVRLLVDWQITPTASQTTVAGFSVSATRSDGVDVPLAQPTVTGVSSPSSGTILYLPNVSGGYIYFLTSDHEVNLSKSYYEYDSSRNVYTLVTLSRYLFALTSDATVDSTKTYYSYNSVTGAYEEISLKQYTYIPTSDASVVSGKTYYQALEDGTYAVVDAPTDEGLPDYYERVENSPTGYYERYLNDPSGVYYERTQASGPFDVESSYTITVHITDKMGAAYSAVRSDILSTAYFTLDVLGDSYRYRLAEEPYDGSKTYYVVSYVYEKTTDALVENGKTYYTRSGSGTEQDPYVYQEVSSPTSSSLESYYERFYNGYEPVANPSSSDLSLYYEASGPSPGHGVAFGMPATTEGFNVRMPTEFHASSLSKDNEVAATRDNTGSTVGFCAENRETGVRSRFIIGEGGNNHGIWSDSLNKWVTYTNGNYTFLHGNSVEVADSGDFSSILTLGDGRNLPASISYHGPTRKGQMIRFYPDSTSDYGDGIVIGGGGSVIVGSGESAENFRVAASIGPGVENTYIVSDGSIQFATNCQTIANRKIASIASSGNFTCRQSVIRISNNVSNAKTVPSANAGVTGMYEYDGSNNRCGYSEVMRTPSGVYRSFAVENPKSSVTTAIYLYADDAAGSFNGHRYGFTDTAAFRSGLGLGTMATKSSGTVNCSAVVTTKTYTTTYSVSASSNVTVSITGITLSNYTLVGFTAMRTGKVGVGVNTWNLSGSQLDVYVHNTLTSAQSNLTLTVEAKWVQTASLSRAVTLA